MANQSQIFQTRTRTRWTTFKWGTRVFILLFLFALVVLVVGLVLMQLNKPGITLESKAIRKVLTQGVPTYRESKMGKEYRGFRKIIDDKWAKGHGCGQINPADLSKSALFNDSVGIRAAFYVNWDKESSFSSLQENISKLNLIIPEWFFLDSSTATLRTEIEPKALQVMKASGIKIMPVLTNNISQVFRGDVVHRILTDTVKRDKLIADITNVLVQYGFVGINIDFEEVYVKDKKLLSAFQQKLYNALHAQELLVSQDVIPFDESYDYKELNQHNDYIILMAYDEHGSFSKPGSISSQKWVENAVDEAMRIVPPQKLILSMAAYGRDWDKNAKMGTDDYCKPVKYDSAVSNAKKYDSYVNFDNDTYNLNYQYYNEEDGLLHEVHFTDAVTTFNIMRFATEQSLAGTTIWRLGGEDKRIWNFYHRPMTKTALAHFDFATLEKLVPGEEPTYFGVSGGEILDVIATPKIGQSRLEFDNDALLISEEYYDTLPSPYIIRKFGNRTKRKLVLSYDDGPDPLYTKQILDTLAYYKVPAAFFVVGIEAESNIPLVKRIFTEGHELGNHTFTHPNIAKVGLNRASIEMDGTRLLIECITGHSTVMFRAPFNADSYPKQAEELVPIALSKEKKYITIGESIDPEDWQKGEIPNFNADTILARVIKKYEERINQTDGDTTGINGNIILLHDAGGDRSETVKATGMIIRYFQAKGYEFTTVADLLDKTPDEVMPPVPKDKDYFWLKFNYVLFMIGYIGKVLFQSLMIVFLTISILRLLLLAIMAFFQQKKEKKAALALLGLATRTKEHPLVSIIVPAYNEEVNAVKSLQNLLQCNYPNFEIIFVDDGSSDATYNNVKAAFNGHDKVKVFTKQNGGKASALNFGIGHSHADYVVCIDADTKLAPDAVSQLMKHFFPSPLSQGRGAGGEVGAVAGTVKVGNEVNLLTKWQSIEYISSQNFDRRGFAYANAITVIPGAIGAFRKDALIEAGGFTTDTLAEDCDITLRILEAGYLVANEPKAVAYTEAPESLKQFMKQRRRWTFGVLQTFWKHKDSLFARSNRSLGWIALPDILMFKYIIPFFTPLADFFMIIGLLTGNAGKIGAYYLVFMVVDAAIAAMAFAYEKENPWKLLWLIPQRLAYRWLMMVVLFNSFRRAIKGELQHWGVLKRTGNVKEV